MCLRVSLLVAGRFSLVMPVADRDLHKIVIEPVLCSSVRCRDAMSTYIPLKFHLTVNCNNLICIIFKVPQQKKTIQ